MHRNEEDEKRSGEDRRKVERTISHERRRGERRQIDAVLVYRSKW